MSVKKTSDPIISELFRLSDLLRYLARQQAAEHQLSILQIRILEKLLHQPQKTHHAATFGQQMMVTHATLSETLRTLQSKKLIRTAKDLQDKRRKAIELTEWGKKVATVAALYTKPVHDILIPMPPEEKRRLFHTLQAIGDKLEQTLQPAATQPNNALPPAGS